MNPLRPSPSLLRRIARLLAATDDRRARAWVDALALVPEPPRIRGFVGVSVVNKYCDGRFIGYEVWRHLDSQRADPTRKKARLWFGFRKYGRTHARNLACQAARMLEGMTRHELHEWWEEYRASRRTGRPVGNLWRDEKRYEDRLDYVDLKQMNHRYASTEAE